MDKVSFNVKKEMCASCAMALRRFIGHMDGVEDVGVEDGKLVISFEGEKIGETELVRMLRDAQIEKKFGQIEKKSPKLLVTRLSGPF